MPDRSNSTRPQTPARSQTPARAETPGRSKTPSRPETPHRTSTLDKLFKKRWRNRTSTSSGVPDIQVESPVRTLLHDTRAVHSHHNPKSTQEVSPVTSAGTISQPHMLSPEASHAELPGLEVMQSYIDPNLIEGKDKRGPPPPPTGPEGVPVLHEGLPPGFVPLTPPIPQYSTLQPVIPSMSRSHTPYTPMYAEADQSSSSRTDSTRSRTTSSSRRSAATPKPATPKPHLGPTYEEAPVPPGVVYPAPPGRSRTPSTTAGMPFPPSPPRSMTPGRGRNGSISSALSPLSIPQLLSPLRTPH